MRLQVKWTDYVDFEECELECKIEKYKPTTEQLYLDLFRIRNRLVIVIYYPVVQSEFLQWKSWLVIHYWADEQQGHFDERKILMRTVEASCFAL